MNKYDFPEFTGITEYHDTEWIPFNFVKSMKDEDKVGKTCHFFIDDYQFERVWRQPMRYLPMLEGFDYVVQPDFSIYRDMPLCVKLWNTYRSHDFARMMDEYGIDVIPAPSWSDPTSLDWCFDGYEQNGIICVSSLGCCKIKEVRQRFKASYMEMVKRLNPTRVLLHGLIPWDDPEGIDESIITQIQPYWRNIDLRKKKQGNG